MTHANRGRLAINLDGAWRLYWGNGPAPHESRVLGTVTRNGCDTGALIRTAIGVYVQGNAGTLRALDQRKVTAAISRLA